MDADAFFVVKMPFEDIRTKDGFSISKLGQDVILTDDRPMGDPCQLNTGVMMNNSPWTKDFWQGVWDLHGPETIEMGLQEDQSGVCLWRQRNREDFGKHVKVIRHALMNNIGSTIAMFIAHMAGGGSASGHEEKYEKLKPFVEAATEKMRGTDGRPARSKSVPAEQFQVMY